MSELQQVAARVDAAAAAVDGVVRVYSAGPVVVDVVRSVVPSIDTTGDALSTVRRGDPVEAVVSVGVAIEASSAEVARSVADAVRAEIGADAKVHVRVSRIHLPS